MRDSLALLARAGGLVTLSGLAAVLQAQAAPPEPYVDRGACPFECCTYGTWVARVALPVYAREGDARPTRWRLQPGDTLVADRGNVRFRRVGVAVLQRPRPIYAEDSVLARARAGDTVYVLSSVGEGWYRLWYRGRITEAEAPWNIYSPPGSGVTAGRLVRRPASRWWVHVRTRDGRQGWITPPLDGVTGHDPCG